MTKKQVAEDFENNILSITHKKNENEIQAFLEANTDLIPIPYLSNHGLHFDFVFSKLAISDTLKSDFAYLTKSSVEWEMVFMELEASNKNIFNDNRKNINFSAEFNNAYDQLLSWSAYLQNHSKEFKDKMTSLMSHMHKNPLTFQFVLVIGRSSELDTDERKNMFAQKSKNDIKILTYDSLIRMYLSNRRDYKNIVSKVKNGIELKSYHSKTHTTAFAYISHGNFFFDTSIRTRLIADGFDIPSWEKGVPLSYNRKLPLTSLTTKLSADFITKEIDD